MNAIRHNDSWGVWKLGDALWWRDEQGVHGTVLTKEPEYGPKGGRKEPGQLTELAASTIDGINELLAELGFGPCALNEDEIAWHGTKRDGRRTAHA